MPVKSLENQLNELEEVALAGESILNFGCEYPAQFSTQIFYMEKTAEKKTISRKLGDFFSKFTSNDWHRNLTDNLIAKLQDRMNVYMESEVFTSDDVALQLDVDDFNFELMESNLDFRTSLINIHPNADLREKLVDKYVALMKKQLGEPKAIHKVDGKFDDYVLRIFFLRNIYNIMFVEFESHILMILYGTTKIK